MERGPEIDVDPQETGEWLAALEDVVRARAGRFPLRRVEQVARATAGSRRQPAPIRPIATPYPPEGQGPLSAISMIEERLTRSCAGTRRHGDPGQQGAWRTRRACCELMPLGRRDLEMGFKPFFRAATPGFRRRPCPFPAAFGARRSCPRLPGGAADRGAAGAPPARGRRGGLCSYPHPRAMPDFGRCRPARWGSGRSMRSIRRG